MLTTGPILTNQLSFIASNTAARQEIHPPLAGAWREEV